ncbi:MAG TPA: tetratricopeptide repeat protein [Vicinamibacterales bacterium]|nr:tetratricopeptide repeat protein [Vicinamibacterales bacterium]
MPRRIEFLIIFAGGALASVALLAQRAPQPAPAAASVTFNRDIAPILWQNCATCHRTGQLGPFSLITYEDARPRAREILRAVENRRMPPWKPEPGHGDFVGIRRLTDAQIGLVRRWIDGGSPQGDPKDSPPAPTWAPGWQLGQPDLIVAMPEPYMLAGSGPDVFRTFVVPIPLSSRRYVRAMEFNPGNFRAVHHANIKIDRTRLSREWDEGEPGPGYEGGGSREAQFPDGHFLGWTPGQSPRVSPPGMSWRLEPETDLVIEMHLMPTGAREPVQASVGLFFTEEPPSKTPYMLRLGRQDLDIRPGQLDYVNADSYTLPVDVDVLAVQPHAHYLAREVHGFATLPDGSARELIYIKDWDFHWQDVYQFAAPLALPKGTVVSMRYTYDNSAANPRNPNRPPRRVTFGQTSASEMGSLWVQVLPHSAADLEALDRDFSPKILADDIAGDEKWLEMNPRDARLHAELAACYFDAGRVEAALQHLREAVTLDPTPLRHYDVGRVLLVARRFPEAGAEFNQALALKRDMPEALYGLGLAFDGLGRLDEAVDAYNRALRLNLDFVDIHFNLARILAAQGKTTEAIAQYEEVLKRRPDDAEAKRAVEELEKAGK